VRRSGSLKWKGNSKKATSLSFSIGSIEDIEKTSSKKDKKKKKKKKKEKAKTEDKKTKETEEEEQEEDDQEEEEDSTESESEKEEKKVETQTGKKGGDEKKARSLNDSTSSTEKSKQVGKTSNNLPPYITKKRNLRF